MSPSPDYIRKLSIKLSEVMEDNGINEEMVMKRRRIFLLMENIYTITSLSVDVNTTAHIFGSQSEGTTTLGLSSDIDLLLVANQFNVMQNWSEWEQNKFNYLMIQDENVTPGYCLLQLLRSDVPLPAINIPNKHHIRDRYGRIFLYNSWLTGFREGAEKHGPSYAESGGEGFSDVDLVPAFPGKSWPQSASSFIEKRGIGLWPSSEMIRYAASNGCFVVGTGSKTSTYPDIEWRISTSLAERCLMFNINLTQIHCYTLLKIISKTYLNLQNQNVLSSFICKTVLFHCIESSEQSLLKRNNLCTCVIFCLIRLHTFIQNDNCPHFMIPENNLLAGQLSAEEKRLLLVKLNDLIHSNGRYLFQIIVNIRNRLRIKLNVFTYKRHDILTPSEIYEVISCFLYINLANCVSVSQLLLYNKISSCNMINRLQQIICNLKTSSASSEKIEQHALRLIIPFVYTALGSSLVSCCIRQNNPVSPQALMCLSLGLNSDVTSGRIKLASVFFCTGDICRAEFVLRETERLYHSGAVQSVCGCHTNVRYSLSEDFTRKCCEQSENCLTQSTLFCIRFLPIESNCVPLELQYELDRSTLEDMPYRNRHEKKWMNFAVIDSPTFLYFLQYKTYGYLQKYQDQQRALNNLIVTTVNGVNLGHRETAFNLLGQCMEQEGKPRAALQFYMLSLQQRARNNVAKFHIRKLLAKVASYN